MGYSKFLALYLHEHMSHQAKTILITGGAKRIGRQMAITLHQAGHNIIVHYRSSAGPASELVAQLNKKRDASAVALQGELLNTAAIPSLVAEAADAFGGIDVLINNASTFYPTPIELLQEDFWNDLVGSNLKAPAFLAKACVPYIRERHGSIINIVDIHARKPMANHPIYCSAKAGLEMLTMSLARDLAPNIRVNGVSPGAILWPEDDSGMAEQQEILDKIPMGRMGQPEDIANLALFLACEDSAFMTGTNIDINGGMLFS
jgi:pteridine reductase